MHAHTYYLAPGDLPSFEPVRALMRHYTSEHLRRMSERELRLKLQHLMSSSRPEFVPGADLSIQRSESTKFVWGHDHDFGSFRLDGRMRQRHIKHVAVFRDHFQALPLDLSGKRVLDVGCWTGGVSLLLAACGAQVLAIDEVGRYCEALNLLCDAFGLEGIRAERLSLYQLDEPRFYDQFDIVVFAGVLYHLSDVIVAMRVLFNVLKDGGTCLIESTGFDAPVPVFGFQRRQWNWFDPSPAALEQLLHDVGFRTVAVGPVTPDMRLYGVAGRLGHVDMRRDGLSNPRIR